MRHQTSAAKFNAHLHSMGVEAAELDGSGKGTEEATSPDFDRLARAYRWLEYLTFGPLLSRTRNHYLPLLEDCRHALVLGDGDGRFTLALLKANRRVRVHAIDASSGMLDQLELRSATYRDRLTTEMVDIRQWAPERHSQFDLIVSHFFLDCLSTSEVSLLAERVTPAASDEARWIISDFATPPNLYGRLVAAPMVAMLYCAFGILTGLKVHTLPDHAAALHAAGWRLEAERPRLAGLLVSQIWRRQCGRRAVLCIPSGASSVS